jgi:hypothetical protein
MTKTPSRSWLLCAVLAAAPIVASAAPVAQFVETIDAEFQRIRVSGVAGADLDRAKAAAGGEALIFAAKQLTGSDAEKDKIDGRRDTISSWADLARPGRVLKTTFEGRTPVIDILIAVNVKELRRKLEADGTLTKQAALAEGLGAPQILVVPDGYSPQKGISPDQQLIVDRVASFLTQRKFEMVDASALKNVGDLTKAVEAIDGAIADPIAEVASVIGADIYFTFTATVTATVRASASVKAYEATTGRLLATGTGESRHYPAGYAEQSALSEAVSDAMPKVFEDVSGYWHEDMAKGRKFLFSITGNFGDRSRQRDFKKALDAEGEVKITVKTAQKVAGTLRSKKSSDDVEDALDDALKSAGFANPTLTLSNRALFVFRAQ